VLQNFYDGLTPMSKWHIDAAAGGAFLFLTIDGATALIEKMMSNQSWEEERKHKRHAYRKGDGHAFRKNGSPYEEAGRACP
jgi:hypothetical protein